MKPGQTTVQREATLPGSTDGRAGQTLPDEPLAGLGRRQKSSLMAMGPTLSERYQISERIAAGGSAEIFLATDRLTGGAVAVKRLRPTLTTEPTARARLRREAKLLRQLSHDGIPELHEELPAACALIMELLPGQPLARLLGGKSPLDTTLVRQIMQGLLAVLSFLHDRAVVHRDIKPGNIMVLQETRESVAVKLLDFGLAASLRGGGREADLTRSGVPMGTPLYMSPEHCRGRGIGTAADVYSLGAVLYEMLSGRPPHCAATPVEILAAHLTQTPAPICTVVSDPQRASLAEMAMAALAKEPKERPLASELLARLRRLTEPPP